ncbi:MAG: hypothetical protein ABJA37_00525 [Ferruginibacter sp.]
MKIVRDDHIPETFEQALAFEQDKQFKLARTLYEKLLKATPGNMKLLTRLMIVCRKLKDYKNEIKYIDRALKIQEAFYGRTKISAPKINTLSKKLNLLLGHTDKKGKTLIASDEILKLQKRKEIVMKKM